MLNRKHVNIEVQTNENEASGSSHSSIDDLRKGTSKLDIQFGSQHGGISQHNELSVKIIDTMRAPKAKKEETTEQYTTDLQKFEDSQSRGSNNNSELSRPSPIKLVPRNEKGQLKQKDWSLKPMVEIETSPKS